jgi:arylsulfatase A-like enzyme
MGKRMTPWWLLALAVVAAGCLESDSANQPNVVLIIIDDLGWTDVGAYGSTFYETPNIDRLAASGALFTQFYAASSVCSPTRASIMTGKYPARLHLTNWIGGEQRGKMLPAEYIRQLPLEEMTVGEAFKKAGYATGFIGKWHLGEEPYYPEFQGFDVNVAGHAAGQPGSYFFPYENERLPWSNVPDLEDGKDGEYLTDRLTDEALDFIAANRDQPFFLVLSHYAVHTPLQAKPEASSRFESKAAALPQPSLPELVAEGPSATTKTRQDHAVYAAMVESSDESVGRILDQLEELGIASNTAVVFVSDNGGLSTLSGERTYMPTANLPLRAGKGWLYEGGIRVPLIIHWPGVVDTAMTIAEPTISTDLYATLLAIAGLTPEPQQHQDGLSLAPLLTQSGSIDRAAIYWHFPHYHGSGNVPSAAVRAGDFKLIEWLEEGEFELYNLLDDPGETKDLAEELPGKAIELRSLLHGWRESMDARMPRQNPQR